MSETEQTFGITLEQVSDYEFKVRFDDTAIPDLTTDETSPLGRDAGPRFVRDFKAGRQPGGGNVLALRGSESCRRVPFEIVNPNVPVDTDRHAAAVRGDGGSPPSRKGVAH